MIWALSSAGPGRTPGLGMEEAVKGLHETSCHQLQGRGGVGKTPLREAKAALGSSTSTPVGGLLGRPGPPSLQCPRQPRYSDTTVALGSLGSHWEIF